MNITASRNLKTALTNYAIQCKYKHYIAKHSKDVRKEFLSFFVNEQGHEYVRSSPVVPFCDPSIPFVNAGMNQFKSIFLGQFSPQYLRVANSQKCIRISGKHNDISAVGSDGSHHTFFEMLGNWSFGDYNKEEACRMAWELMTGPYGFQKNNLVITYFSGDKKLGLEADMECRDIWLKIGVPSAQLIPCDIKDNFWEMGATGPCGPCTEIHFCESNGNLIEVWNIVFIQYLRQADGTIVPLPKLYIDTGMGLERVTALLQNKKSNYDTDLFIPLMETIHKKSGTVPIYQGKFGENENIDKSYRILADHARMVSICLADGVFPCRNLRLKNVLRRAISISKNTFKCPPGLMLALYDKVVESLGDTYPELYEKMNSAKQIIMHEEDSFLALESSTLKDRKALIKKYPETSQLTTEILPGLAEAYKQFKEEMKSVQGPVIPGNIAFRLYDTFGLDENVINQIAEINNLSIDIESFKNCLLEHKTKHKAVFTEAANSNIKMDLNNSIYNLTMNNISPTVDVYKYDYTAENDCTYTFPKLKSQLKAILADDGSIIQSINTVSNKIHHLIFDKSNFYCEEGGQCRDSGYILIGKNTVFKVNSVSNIQGYVLHSGTIENNKDHVETLNIGDHVEMFVDNEKRFSTMQHHTTTHLLNAAIKKILPESVTCQLSSKVNSSGLVLDLAIYGTKLSPQVISQVEDLVRVICSANIPVNTQIINSQELSKIGDVTTVPGEIYPEAGIKVVEIKLPESGETFSKELCCGTHLISTDHVKDFTITAVRGAGGHAPTIRAVAGKLATQLNILAQDAKNLHKEIEENEISDREAIQDRIKSIRNGLDKICKGDGAPYGTRLVCLETLGLIEKRLKERNTKALVDLVQEEMSTLLFESDTKNKQFLVHFLACSYLLEPGTLSLTTAIQCIQDKPILVLGCASGIIKATCQVPKNCISEHFNAEKWLASIIPVFGTGIVPPVKNQDLNFIAHMKGKKVSLINCESLVASAIEEGTAFANANYKHDSIHPKRKNENWQEENLNKKRNHSS